MLVNLIFGICLVLRCKLWGQFVLSLINTWRFVFFFFPPFLKKFLFICFQAQCGKNASHFPLFHNLYHCDYTHFEEKDKLFVFLIRGNRLNIIQSSSKSTKQKSNDLVPAQSPPFFWTVLDIQMSSFFCRVGLTLQDGWEAHDHFGIYGPYINVLWLQAKLLWLM